MSATAKNMRDAYEVIRALTTIDVERRHIEITPIEEIDLGAVACDFFEVVRAAHRHGKGRKGR